MLVLVLTPLCCGKKSCWLPTFESELTFMPEQMQGSWCWSKGCRWTCIACWVHIVVVVQIVIIVIVVVVVVIVVVVVVALHSSSWL